RGTPRAARSGAARTGPAECGSRIAARLPWWWSVARPGRLRPYRRSRPVSLRSGQGFPAKAVLAGLLGGVHGGVGVGHQGIRVLAVPGVDCRADAGVDMYLDVIGQVEGLGQGFEDRAGNPFAAFEAVQARQDDAELVAAEAGHGVLGIGANAVLQPAGHLLQQDVADRVAMAVVDFLEAV